MTFCMDKTDRYKQVGIFSGSFNPVHNGHVALASYIVSHSNLDELWMLVSPQNPLKTGREQVDAWQRVEMLKLALKDYYPIIKASDYELSLPTPTYTYETLQQLSQDFPDCRFSLIIGADNMLVFKRWFRWQDIITKYRIIVYPRNDIDMYQMQQEFDNRMDIIEAPLFNISSTMIRNKVAHGEDISQYVDTEVANYIKKHHLYI